MWDILGAFAFIYLLIDAIYALLRGFFWLMTLPFKILAVLFK